MGKLLPLAHLAPPLLASLTCSTASPRAADRQGSLLSPIRQVQLPLVLFEKSYNEKKRALLPSLSNPPVHTHTHTHTHTRTHTHAHRHTNTRKHTHTLLSISSPHSTLEGFINAEWATSGLQCRCKYSMHNMHVLKEEKGSIWMFFCCHVHGKH